MPIYEFICDDGHLVERILTVSRMERAVHKQDLFCDIKVNKWGEPDENGDYCGLILKKIWSLPAKSAPIDDGKGLVYFENKKGHVEFSSIADKDKWQPEGYVKKEARNLHEREMLERKLRRQDDSRLAEQFEKRDMQRHYSESVRHSDIRNMINQGAVDEKSAALLKKGMERTRNRTRRRPKSELRLSVNHESASTIKNKK